MRLLVLLTAAALPLMVSAPAEATPALWKWRTVHSADGKAAAWGEVAIHQFGHVVDGNLRDTRGQGCAWAVLRAQSARDGRWKTHRHVNCAPGTRTFRRDYRDVLQARVQVCTGNAVRPTGACSRWKTIITMG